MDDEEFDWKRAAAVAVALQAHVIANSSGDRKMRMVTAYALSVARDNASPAELEAASEISLAFSYSY